MERSVLLVRVQPTRVMPRRGGPKGRPSRVEGVGFIVFDHFSAHKETRVAWGIHDGMTVTICARSAPSRRGARLARGLSRPALLESAFG